MKMVCASIAATEWMCAHSYFGFRIIVYIKRLMSLSAPQKTRLCIENGTRTLKVPIPESSHPLFKKTKNDTTGSRDVAP